jgi:hypothetical protein
MIFCDQQPARVGNLMHDNMIGYCVWASRESVPTEAGNFSARDGGFVFSCEEISNRKGGQASECS